MKRTVNHSNFESIVSEVELGKAILYIPTCTRTIKIDKKCFLRFRQSGLVVIAKDSDGKGFRLQSGRSRVYVLPEQLIALS